MKAVSLAALLLAAFAATASAEWVKLDKATLQSDPSNDGDSFHVVCNGKAYYFRLYFVDCPETQDRLKDRILEQAQVFGIDPKNVLKLGKVAEDFGGSDVASAVTKSMRPSVRGCWRSFQSAVNRSRHSSSAA